MTLHVYEFPCFLPCSLPNLVLFSVNHSHHIINVRVAWAHRITLFFYYHHHYTGCQRYGSQTTGLTNATWASMTGQRGRRLSWLQGMFFLPLCVSTNSYTASLHFQTKQTSFFFFSPISLHTVFNVFVVKTGCWGGTWVTWRGTVQSQQVGQYDKDGKTGCGVGLQAGGKAFLITSVRFQVLHVVPEGRCFQTGTVCWICCSMVCMKGYWWKIM